MTDYRNMTLREELEARFEEYEEKQREKDEYNNYYGVVNQNTPSYSLNFEKNLTSKREDGNGINSYVNNSASDSYQSVYDQIKGSLSDMTKEYFLMHSHNFKNLDDYYHCKANYNAARRGPVGNMIATIGGNEKEAFDYFKNRLRGLSVQQARQDYWHDLEVNAIGRGRAKNNPNLSAADACADYREKNKSLPKKYW